MEELTLFTEETRRASYKKWVFNSSQSCNADKMAEAGFIFVGSSRDPDSVECFFCKKSLDGWEAEDNPWKEHLSHSPLCGFAKMQKPQRLWTLNQWIDIEAEYKKKLVVKKYEDVKKQIKKMHQVEV